MMALDHLHRADAASRVDGMVRARDTSPEAASVQAEIFRRMTPSQRVALAAEMSDEVLAVAAAGLKDRNPELSPEDAAHALRDLLLGPELAARVRRYG